MFGEIYAVSILFSIGFFIFSVIAINGDKIEHKKRILIYKTANAFGYLTVFTMLIALSVLIHAKFIG